MTTRSGQWALLMFLPTLAACDTAAFVADSSAAVLERVTPTLAEYWDYETAGDAAPGAIIQLEGMLRIVPENEVILEQLARAYIGYAYGWIEADAEALEFEGKYEEADEVRRRARMMYLRAIDLSRQWIRVSDPGIDEALQGSLPEFEQWLSDTFQEKEDAAKLVIAGYAMASYTNAAKDDMDAVAQLGYAEALIRRSIELDPDYDYAAGYTFMGVMAAVEFGGDREESKAFFEKALEITDRRALLVQLNMARFYAVQTQNRELFNALLSEVLEAGDVLPAARMPNRIARVRAQLYLDNADQLF
ncbi:MAG: TRAP transporter TatT component family protein [Myxococcota bacterium]